MTKRNQGPKFEINETTGRIVTANNMLVDAKKTGGEQQAQTMKNLLQVLVDNPGAIEIFSAMQE